MDERIDKNTEDMLMKALENSKAFGQRLHESREKRLWKEVNIPCSLHDAMSELTKDEMDKIRKNYYLKNLSALKKPELATELTRLIPLKFKNFIYTLDQGRYDFVKKIIMNSGVIPDNGISVSNAEAFMRYSMVFPGVCENKKVLFIPTELANIFAQTDVCELENIIRRNTEWIRLTHGLLYYYGVMEAWLIKGRIEEITGEKIDISEYLKVMSFACDFYGQIQSTQYGYKDDRVFDAKKIAEEHRMRPEVNYYPFTKKQLLKAGDPDYVDRTPQMNSFISFLSDHYRLADQEINEIALQIINMINSDSKPTLIIQYLQSWLEFPSFEFEQVLTEKILELYNNTRLWALKGHTPNELFPKESKFLKPMPTEPYKTGQSNAKIISMATRAKVGRNDSCPCGSGKKYKKCCGK